MSVSCRRALDNDWRTGITSKFKPGLLISLSTLFLCLFCTYSQAVNSASFTTVSDYDDDGVTNYVTTRQVMSATHIQYNIDANGDGAIDSIKVTWTDQMGRSAGMEQDVNADGVVDYRVEFQRDQLGRLIGIITDSNGDGIADAIEYWRYNAVGKRVSRLTDRNADGLVD